MPKLIDIHHDEVIDLQTCIAHLQEAGFDPQDDRSVKHAAYQLRGLYNNRTFLTDIIMDELKHRCHGQNENNAYSGQSIMLHSANGILVRANIWPARDHFLMRRDGENAFYFNMPHDHNFDFLTLGYMGSGYWSEYYEYDYEKVIGYAGEKVDLQYIETSRLDEGKILLYRAHKDVHHQLPADTLSISINVMHQNITQPWYDQYHFDIKERKIVKILNHVSGEILLRMAVHLVPDCGKALAREYMENHPSDRMRLSAFHAILSATDDVTNTYATLEHAQHNDNIYVQKQAAAMLKICTKNMP